MKRPMLLLSVSFIIGILTARISRSYFFIAASIIIIFAIYITFVSNSVQNKRPKHKIIFYIMVLFYLFGAVEYLFIDDINLSRFKNYEDQEINIKGVVSSQASIKESRVSYVIKVKSITDSQNGVNRDKNVLKKSGNVLLTTLLGEKGTVYEYGREIEFSGKLTVPMGKRNPGGFNYRNYLAQSGISASMFVRDENISIGKEVGGNYLIRLGKFLNKRIVEVFEKSLPQQQAGLLSGMLIGNRDGLTKEVLQVFSDSGLSHIMSVSGANVAFIIFPFIFILRKVGLKRYLANIIAICVLIIFVFITGFEPSVQRAAVMAVVILIGQLLRRDADVMTSISFAALLLLVVNPYNLFNIGFQLSFAATISLILFYKRIKELIKNKCLPRPIIDALAVTIAAQIGVLPITVYYFNNLSLVSILSNLLVAPVVEIITILGSIMAVIGQISTIASSFIGYINCTLLSFVLFTSKFTSSIPFAVVRIITPSIFIVIVYYAAVGFFLWYKPVKNVKIKPKYYLIGCLVAFIIITIPLFLPKDLEVVFIDVGQGDSIFIRTYRGNTVLIDGGGRNYKDGDTNIGDSVVIPFLLDNGVTHLDLVVATHGHDDHIQGLLPIIKDFGVSNFVLPEFGIEKEFKELLESSKLRNINTEFLQRGDSIRLDDETIFSVLSPDNEAFVENASLNNSSLVLKLHYKDVKMLFTGDIEAEIERKLIEDKVDISADILKIAHHGSKTSNTEEFFELVNPRATIISVGKNNFGHPSTEVIKRIDEMNVHSFRTDKHGAVLLKTDGKIISITTIIQ